MKGDEKHILIKGKFSPSEAKEILLHLFSHKINFHEMRNFSSMERFGKKDIHSIKRAAELKETREQIIKLLEKSVNEKKNLRIDSVIKIGMRK